MLIGSAVRSSAVVLVRFSAGLDTGLLGGTELGTADAESNDMLSSGMVILFLLRVNKIFSDQS